MQSVPRISEFLTNTFFNLYHFGKSFLVPASTLLHLEYIRGISSTPSIIYLMQALETSELLSRQKRNVNRGLFLARSQKTCSFKTTCRLQILEWILTLKGQSIRSERHSNQGIVVQVLQILEPCFIALNRLFKEEEEVAVVLTPSVQEDFQGFHFNITHRPTS